MLGTRPGWTKGISNLGFPDMGRVPRKDLLFFQICELPLLLDARHVHVSPLVLFQAALPGFSHLFFQQMDHS
jgi:hypothetical protein